MGCLKSLFVLLLVCRIFSWTDGRGEESTEQAINKWIANKRVISITQSSSCSAAIYGRETVITIIAETL